MTSIGQFIKSLPPEKYNEINSMFWKKNISQKVMKIATRLNNIKSYDDLYRSLIMENIDNNIFTNSFIEELNNSSTQYESELKDF